MRFDWAALDTWLEEDEQVFVHPRNPYVRVDALRSTRNVRVELDGVLLGESASPIMVFETGLPTRYSINKTEIHFEHLLPTDTVTECPYKGTTSGYWSVRVGDVIYPDLAWSYEFPTRQLLPIAGLIAFYNEKVDIPACPWLLLIVHRPTSSMRRTYETAGAHADWQHELRVTPRWLWALRRPL